MPTITLNVSQHLMDILKREAGKSALSLEEELAHWLAAQCALREKLTKHAHWKLAIVDNHDRVVRELDLP
jgi:hypothetical protein